VKGSRLAQTSSYLGEPKVPHKTPPLRRHCDPCLELMRDHPVYLKGKPQRISHYQVGDVKEKALREIWEDEEYAAFRDKVRRFPYSPCLTYGGYDLSGPIKITAAPTNFSLKARPLGSGSGAAP